MPANVVSAWGNSKLMKLFLPDIAGIGAGMPITKAIYIDGLMLLQKVSGALFYWPLLPLYCIFNCISIQSICKDGLIYFVKS